MKKFGNKDRGYGLKQRNRGTLVGYEKLPGYQAISQWCVDRSPDPYTTESYLCSGIIDFGIGLFIESQTLNDLLLCIASRKFPQCARTDLNKRFLPKPMTTTG